MAQTSREGVDGNPNPSQGASREPACYQAWGGGRVLPENKWSRHSQRCKVFFLFYPTSHHTHPQAWSWVSPVVACAPLRGSLPAHLPPRLHVASGAFSGCSHHRPSSSPPKPSVAPQCPDWAT